MHAVSIRYYIMLINFKGFTNSHYTKHVRELCDIAIRDDVKQRDHLDNE